MRGVKETQDAHGSSPRPAVTLSKGASFSRGIVKLNMRLVHNLEGRPEYKPNILGCQGKNVQRVGRKARLRADFQKTAGRGEEGQGEPNEFGFPCIGPGGRLEFLSLSGKASNRRSAE